MFIKIEPPLTRLVCMNFAGNELCGRLLIAFHERGGCILVPLHHCGGSFAWLLLPRHDCSPGLILAASIFIDQDKHASNS